MSDWDEWTDAETAKKTEDEKENEPGAQTDENELERVGDKSSIPSKKIDYRYAETTNGIIGARLVSSNYVSCVSHSYDDRA